ncbi:MULTISPECIES: pyrroline-5-carboxylate reductase [Bacillaceae]|uniref:pyrroline-5-carboxylate reductase n=1 Tax=Bacillaceae TaxID=186817 RepID=UPI001E434DAE|nr:MULTISPECIES: pyrroline-5-carboxylate reductase [Bacillaceae]MCE4051126.1 pyrroline-5-carboxylate reductase [Bacillus sp. Au-Bac7]MCM3030269.1 pyrroline-5-carboxylate reductase [Niallia sp. MER 6]MDL0436850.1 pyrroline-5-carboxylate reductase [Niallia sp. SS-2023]UPO88241.1 pyrroline-5-carboxylate reductase [Niallia sp. Man26]
MNNKKISFIGSGKMAQAIFGGMLKSGFTRHEDLIASAKTAATSEMISKQYEIKTTIDNKIAASYGDIVVLAVKPYLYTEVLQEIKESIQENAIIVTIAAGVDLAYMEEQLSSESKIIRTMPNTPSLVGEGMSVVCPNGNVTEEEVQYIVDLFSSFGKVEVMEERLMDAIPAISGSSPAYAFLFIEALADGGVRSGIPRDTSYKLAAQALLGAAKMVLETGKHPGILKDEVCTPGGTTIEAIATLEQMQFRGAVMAAMDRCTEKNKELQKK